MHLLLRRQQAAFKRLCDTTCHFSETGPIDIDHDEGPWAVFCYTSSQDGLRGDGTSLLRIGSAGWPKGGQARSCGSRWFLFREVALLVGVRGNPGACPIKHVTAFVAVAIFLPLSLSLSANVCAYRGRGIVRPSADGVSRLGKD